MVRAPLIKLSLIIRSSLSPINSRQNPISNELSVFIRPPSHTFSSSSSSSSSNTNPPKKTQTVEVSNPTEEDVDDVDKRELKTRINKFYEGDMDAIPSIFEAILKRKLTGNHDDSDNELVEELRQKYPGEINHEEFFDESESCSDSDSDSDSEKL